LASAHNLSAGSGAGAPDQVNFGGRQRRIEDMVRSWRDGTPLLIDGTQARNTVAFVRALSESAERGVPVKLASSVV